MLIASGRSKVRKDNNVNRYGIELGQDGPEMRERIHTSVTGLFLLSSIASTVGDEEDEDESESTLELAFVRR